MLRRVLALLVALAGVASAAEPLPPSPTRWLTDGAGALKPATRTALDAELEAYQHKTGHQVVVWIGRSIGSAAGGSSGSAGRGGVAPLLDDWAVRTFASWKVGRKGLDDGVVMFVLMDDRKIDIEVGYGLEPVLTDAQASRIIREVMAPALQRGDPDGAVTAGVDAILAAIGEGVPSAGTVQPSEHARPEMPLAQKILFGVLALLAIAFLVTHPRTAIWLLSSMMSGRGFGGGGGGGGFSGGGGRSGGGGARGRLVMWARSRRFQRDRITRAIKAAETRTSGEIVVSLAPFFWGNVERAARRAFDRLGVAHTRQHNGILFFVVPSRRRFMVLGDEGIHQRVGPEFWQHLADTLSTHFRRGAYTEGLEAAIADAGASLSRYFPPSPDDTNELPDEPV